MKVYLKLITLFFILSTLSVHAQKIRVLSYNIQHGQNANGKIDIETLATFIKSQNADIVGLQEVDSVCHRSGQIDILKELGRLTGMYHYFGKAFDFDGGGYGNGVLSKYPLLSTKTISLPQPEKGDHEPRVAIQCEVMTGNRKIKFITTHLDSKRNDSCRLMQTDYLSRIYKNEKLPFIICGDFNAGPEANSIKKLLLLTKQPSSDNNQPTWPADKPKNKLDYILFSKNATWPTTRFSVINEPEISDHRPVICEVGK